MRILGLTRRMASAAAARRAGGDDDGAGAEPARGPKDEPERAEEDPGEAACRSSRARHPLKACLQSCERVLADFRK
jgi:hypothetical protein